LVIDSGLSRRQCCCNPRTWHGAPPGHTTARVRPQPPSDMGRPEGLEPGRLQSASGRRRAKQTNGSGAFDPPGLQERPIRFPLVLQLALWVLGFGNEAADGLEPHPLWSPARERPSVAATAWVASTATAGIQAHPWQSQCRGLASIPGWRTCC